MMIHTDALSGTHVGGINVFGVIITQLNPPDNLINHELIHSAQYRELWYIGFVFLYWYYQLTGRFIYGTWREAYEMNPLEQEAYYYEGNNNYLAERKPFAWKGFIRTLWG